MKLSMELFIAASWAVVIVYVLATIANVAGVLFRNDRFERISYWVAGCGLALHTCLIAVWWAEVAAPIRNPAGSLRTAVAPSPVVPECTIVAGR